MCWVGYGSATVDKYVGRYYAAMQEVRVVAGRGMHSWNVNTCSSPDTPPAPPYGP